MLLVLELNRMVDDEVVVVVDEGDDGHDFGAKKVDSGDSKG